MEYKPSHGRLSNLCEGFEMHAQNAFPVFAGILALCACAVAPPAGPNVIALPPQGKDLGQFQREDASCRQYAAMIGSGPGSQTPTPLPARSSSNMTLPMRNAWPLMGITWDPNPIRYTPYYDAYGVYAYPAYYGPWFGPTIGVGSIGVFGPRFHHAVFAHHPGFAHGGFSHRH
jgi:hypothetical protein